MSDTIEHERTDEIICPYCGYTFSDSYELADDETVTCHGEDCEKKFYLETHRAITYTTSKVPCPKRNMEHQWADPYYHTRGQRTVDEWNAEKFLNKTDWTDAGYWTRECAACDHEEVKEVALGAPCPWAEVAA